MFSSTYRSQYKQCFHDRLSAPSHVFTVRIEDEILKKFHYVAEYNARSANKEVAFLIRKRIADFEKAHGKITLE